jgi:hypothetical protein
MPRHLRLDNGAYEEDGEYNLVVLGFPDEAEQFGRRLRDALEHMDVLYPDEERRAHGSAVSDRLNAAARAGTNLLTVEFTPFKPAPLSEIEDRVIRYLARCVYENRWPIRYPEDEEPGYPELLRCPRLEEWVALLARVPTVDGEWATRPGPWRQHWFWTVRHEEDQAAREAYDERLMREYERTEQTGVKARDAKG